MALNPNGHVLNDPTARTELESCVLPYVSERQSRRANTAGYKALRNPYMTHYQGGKQLPSHSVPTLDKARVKKYDNRCPYTYTHIHKSS